MRLFDGLTQVMGDEGLAHESEAGGFERVVAAHENDHGFGGYFEDLSSNLATGIFAMRHHEIDQEDIERGHALREEQRVLGARGTEDGVTAAFEAPHGEAPDARLVVDDEHLQEAFGFFDFELATDGFGELPAVFADGVEETYAAPLVFDVPLELVERV